MAQKANGPEPGRTFDTRGVGSTASVDPSMRKTGYRPDAQMNSTDNSQDPDVLIRTAQDPRLA